jgi:hypothetical protein
MSESGSLYQWVREVGIKLTAVHFLACLRRISTIRKTNKRKPFCSARVTVFGQEYSCDMPEACEHISQVSFLGEFAHLSM